MNSFFRELKQRKVYRVALGYAVVAWLVIQISATVMPTYHAPDWILPVLITVVALGFTVAQLFRPAEPAQCLQSRGRIRGDCLALTQTPSHIFPFVRIP